MNIPTYGNPLNSRLAPEFKRFAHLFAELNGLVLDAPCGLGRHAIHLQEMGCSVVCVDSDEAAIQILNDKDKISPNEKNRLLLTCLDLKKPGSYFDNRMFAGVVSVHFYDKAVFRRLADSVAPGGLFYFETISNRKGNFQQLPDAGSLQAGLGKFEFISYRESPAGPPGCNKVTARFLARKVLSRDLV